MSTRASARFVACALLVAAPACRRTIVDTAPAPAGSDAPAPPGSTSVASANDAAPRTKIEIELAIAGDVIPHRRVVEDDLDAIFASVPSCWSRADARVLNLEAPIGGRVAGKGEEQLLVYASPPDWFGKLATASHASVMVAANNHSCDLGPAGLSSTLTEASHRSMTIAGVSADDPWTPVEVVDKAGRRVCIVAWTTFLNDKGKRQTACVEGVEPYPARVARAELSKAGTALLHEKLGGAHRWEGCDARIAYLHGGGEYRAQLDGVLEQASAAATYVDAVIVSHPHVPDAVEVIAAPPRPAGADAEEPAAARASGRGVPVFKSLGNFVSNQGYGWSLGMSAELITAGGTPDPLSIVWTRVAMIARLRLSWDADAAVGAPPSDVRYGFTLAFTERGPKSAPTIRLRALPASVSEAPDAVAAKLRKGPKPFAALLDAPCRLDDDAAPTCEATAPR